MKVSETVEAQLADLVWANKVYIGERLLSDEEKTVICKALRDRARWMASDTRSGERRRRAG